VGSFSVALGEVEGRVEEEGLREVLSVPGLAVGVSVWMAVAVALPARCSEGEDVMVAVEVREDPGEGEGVSDSEGLAPEHPPRTRSTWFPDSST
jgi:hypothetical protein